MIAASQGKSACIRLLAEGGADLNARNDVGWTALLVAANANKPKAVNMLLTLGADPNVCNNYSKNCFDIATDCGHENVLKVLNERNVVASDKAVRVGDARKVRARAPFPLQRAEWRARDEPSCSCSSAAEAGRIEGPTERSRRGQKLGLEGARAKEAHLLLLLFCG
jgi:hypothetical protein